MFRNDVRKKPPHTQTRRELDPEFAGAVTHFPSHGRVNHKQIPSIPSYQAHHLQYPPTGHNESVMHFLEKTAGLSWEAAFNINLQIRGNLHALLQMKNEEIRRDVRAVYPWRSKAEYLKYTVTDLDFKMLFAALEKERASSNHHHVQFASNSDIQNPFFV